MLTVLIRLGLPGTTSEHNRLQFLVPPVGFEPTTLGLEVLCSIQLSYRGTSKLGFSLRKLYFIYFGLRRRFLLSNFQTAALGLKIRIFLQKYLKLERVAGIEPAFSAWKADIIATIRHPRI